MPQSPGSRTISPLVEQPTPRIHYPSRWLTKLVIALTGIALSGATTVISSSALATQFQRSLHRAVLAQATQPAPAELQALIGKIDTAASQRDIKAVTEFYAPEFRNSDGLDRQALEKALTRFWQGQESLTYRTQINAWQATRDGFTAETTTTITGRQKTGGREIALESTLRSLQRIVGQRIVSQEITAEQTLLRSGQSPPTVQMSLPTQVKVGEEYNLDAIVQEPLKDSLLLGLALEEPITPEAYFKTPPLDLQLLTAGGIFKVGKAPEQPGDRWVSIALVRDSGMTLITQRLKVVR